MTEHAFLMEVFGLMPGENGQEKMDKEMFENRNLLEVRIKRGKQYQLPSR